MYRTQQLSKSRSAYNGVWWKARKMHYRCQNFQWYCIQN